MPADLETVQDIITATDDAKRTFNGLTEVWWRGQEKQEWDLIPRIYTQSDVNDNDVGTHEKNIVVRFRQKAPTRHSNCPPVGREHYPARLFFMQHYGLPTRLLDWTSSVLVAAYFACREKPEENAALWAMDPFALNESQMGKQELFQPVSDCAKDCFWAPFINETLESGQKTMAVMAPEVDIRMLLQSSNFTIHGANMPLNNIDSSAVFLKKYVIPYAAKPIIIQTLKRLGIRETSLFPDLERLAEEIKTYRIRPR